MGLKHFVIKSTLWFLILTAVTTVLLWFIVIVYAHGQVSECARAIAYVISEEGCLPENETVEYTVHKNGTQEQVVWNMQARTAYTETFHKTLEENSNLLSIFLSFPSDCIMVRNAEGDPAFKYKNASQRGSPVTVTVTAEMSLPLPFYPGWEVEDKEPTACFRVSKSITVFAYKYQKDV